MSKFKFSFERRRYGKKTYTWAFVHIDEKKFSLGDPWPCVNPKLTELEEAASYRIQTPVREG